MPQDFNLAINILIVGMVTVFIVLSLVVLTGRVIIFLVNSRVAPESKPGDLPTPQTAEVYSPLPMHLAAIVATVEVVTQGKGQITKIKKL